MMLNILSIDQYQIDQLEQNEALADKEYWEDAAELAAEYRIHQLEEERRKPPYIPPSPAVLLQRYSGHSTSSYTSLNVEGLWVNIAIRYLRKIKFTCADREEYLSLIEKIEKVIRDKYTRRPGETLEQLEKRKPGHWTSTARYGLCDSMTRVHYPVGGDPDSKWYFGYSGAWIKGIYYKVRDRKVFETIQEIYAIVKLIDKYEGKAKEVRKRKPANRKSFTEGSVLRLKPTLRQYLVWDAGTDAARGLAVLVSPAGAKSFRCAYYFPGSAKPHFKHLGRVGEMTLEEARTLTRRYRRAARTGRIK